MSGSARPMNPERGDDWATGKGGRPGVGPSDSQPASSAAQGRLTRSQRAALHLIRNHGYGYVGEEGREGVVTSGPTCLIDGQPWINWRTAAALERRGLAEVRGIGEETTVWAK